MQTEQELRAEAIARLKDSARTQREFENVIAWWDRLEKQLRKEDVIDSIFYCPYDIHELVTEEYLSKILWELTEEHKELLFLCAVRLFSSTRIAKIRNQSGRNIQNDCVMMALALTMTDKPMAVNMSFQWEYAEWYCLIPSI